MTTDYVGESIDQRFPKEYRMKKSELLHIIDQELLDKLYGFCYRRTPSSQAAQELCSDIVFELVKTANSEGELGGEGEDDRALLYAIVWRIAHRVYADRTERHARESARSYTGDPDALFALLSDEEEEEERAALMRDREMLCRIWRQIADLSHAYRTVMIAYYLDGRSVREIAQAIGASETAIRQRLFAARETVRKEVTNMENNAMNKPITLHHLELSLLGNGDPNTGDPRSLLDRQLSRHILWLCRNRALSAREIADELNVPMIYIEEELDIQTRGIGNTHYGTLRRLPSGKYISNIPLLSREECQEGRRIYQAHYPALCKAIRDYIRTPGIAKQYFDFPYLNRRHDAMLHLIWWQHMPVLAYKLSDMVEELLKEKYFADVTPAQRPFHLFGYEAFEDDDDALGWDGIAATNICGYRKVGVENLYTSRRHLRPHFHCGHDIANDEKLQLALRAIDGLPVSALSEDEQEQAARAIECGYLMREDDTLYTKILVMERKDAERVYLIDHDLREQIRPIAEEVAEQTAAWLRSVLPEHQLADYLKFTSLASSGVPTAVLADLCQHCLLEIPEGGLGAEGCWMTVEK